MNRLSHPFFTILPTFMVCLTSVFFLSLLSDSSGFSTAETLQTIANWQWEDRSLSLPDTLPCSQGRTSFTLTTTVEPSKGDYLYLKTVYSPLRVYAEGELIFQYGQPESYPAFLLDPPTKVALFPLPDTDKTITLTLEYLSPTQRNYITLHPVLMGSPDMLLSHLFSTMGFSLIFSGILMILGILLWITALVVTRFEKKGIALFWLGLFSFCTGTWILCECNLTGLFIKNPNILYGIAFGSLFILTIPLIKFCMIMFGTHQKATFTAMCRILELSVCTAILLQLMGKVSLSKSLYLFHILDPLALFLCSFCILREQLNYQNPLARRFLFPIGVLAIFSLLEVANYYLFHWNVQKSFFFQIGALAFLVIISILFGYFLCDTLILRMKNRQLAFEVSLMEKQIEAQKNRYHLLSELSSKLRQQRHDFKHHVSVLYMWTTRGETNKLMEYLKEVSAGIPDGFLGNLCENEAVNTVAQYYQSVARENNLPITLQLDIPADTGQVSASDLCVIIGNLLENGITACMEAKEPFLTMRSRLSNGILTITMDNRFSSVLKTPQGTFLSTKSGGGIGLLSIQSVAEKYGGACRFEDKDHVFYSSVYLYLFP